MNAKPHSKTVRGTLDNPKTQEAMSSGSNPSQLGDTTSLKLEHDDKELPSNDSAPPHGNKDVTDVDGYRKKGRETSSRQKKSCLIPRQ
ncbi:hypothetical protein GQ44DRAFT_177702 [Phaeosphaeriaceae sp. PMI808]|nr:hypothetical protein GQ44DRAFT_177702 [Phaeosphaeriaceae sp. PMI808]